MMPELGARSVFGGGASNDYNEEAASDRGRELGILRSGSAPPTVEGALGGGFSGGAVSEEELRSDPAYRSYYYQNVKLNPRLPHPLPSREDRVLQRPAASSVVAEGGEMYETGGGGGGGGESLFAMQPGFGGFEEEKVMQGRWGGEGLVGYAGVGGSKQKTAADMVQDGMRYPRTVSRSQAFGEAESSETRVPLHHELAPLSTLDSDRNMQSFNLSASQSYASVMGASPRTSTPDLVRSPSPRTSAVGGGRMSSLDQRYINKHDLYDETPQEMVTSADIITSLSNLSLSSGTLGDVRKYQKQHPYSNDSLKAQSMPTFNHRGSSPSQYLNTARPTFSPSNFGLGGYPASPLLLGNQIGYGDISAVEASPFGGGLTFESDFMSASAELESFGRLGNQSTIADPAYLQHLRLKGYSSASLQNQQMHGEHLVNSPVEFLTQRNAYFEALRRRSQYGLGCGKSSTMSNGFHGNPAFNSGFPYGNPLRSSVFPNSPGGPDRNVEQIMGYSSTLRNMAGNFGGPWLSRHGISLEESFAASLLDEFKGNKARCLELGEIVGHVVEFSVDQFGSRFIQQKLETASTQEKNMIFLEIMPQALSLMTDVFGNYVIQKFLEHGSASQTRQLAEQLIGHVLTLSLQMYGCRVIQKALEVIELDQKREMVAELDGHVLRCVRDQNGNHVIQKCIECVPENDIDFIVTTFYDQVVTLSTHPYGCRVIQRVLEHCDSPKTQTVVMNEILQSVNMLAQDQYGNYVIQHVLEHGKPSERSIIISQLTGKIVEMSQQKFASNVIEKCLSFGTQEERQALVHEMLGTTDENEPLQIMMKDQFANYVVQKVLETCEDQQLELLLNRIKVHLNALKKYTYGKHIVARVEKLVAAGERRIIALSAYST